MYAGDEWVVDGESTGYYDEELARIGVPPESRFFLAERMVTTLITEFGPATE